MLGEVEQALVGALLNPENHLVFVLEKEKKLSLKEVTRDISRRFAINVFEENGYDVQEIYDLDEELSVQLAQYGRS